MENQHWIFSHYSKSLGLWYVDLNLIPYDIWAFYRVRVFVFQTIKYVVMAKMSKSLYEQRMEMQSIVFGMKQHCDIKICTNVIKLTRTLSSSFIFSYRPLSKSYWSHPHLNFAKALRLLKGTKYKDTTFIHTLHF